MCKLVALFSAYVGQSGRFQPPFPAAMPGGGERGRQPTCPVRAVPLRLVRHRSADRTSYLLCSPLLSTATVFNCLAAFADGGSHIPLAMLTVFPYVLSSAYLQSPPSARLRLLLYDPALP